MIHYDPLKDRSEEFGWRKVCDEHVPTDEEQDRWGKITFVVAVCLAVWTLLFHI
jgi:hypothetical protein